MKPAIVGIVIVTYNAAETIAPCLESVTALTYPHIMPLVIDNASSDATQTLLKTQYPAVQLIQNSHNVGFAAASNQGIKILLKKNCDYILLLNPDTVIQPDTLEQLLQPFQDTSVGISGSAVMYFQSETIWYAGGSFNPYFAYTRHAKMGQPATKLSHAIHPTDFVTGCCMLIRKQVFERIGYLDPSYAFYFEDADFCLRAKQHGIISSVIELPLVQHRVSASTGRTGSNRMTPFKAYYFGRNPFFLIQKHMQGWRRMSGLIGQLCIRLPFYGFHMLKYGDIQSFGSYLHGFTDGIRLIF